MTATAGLINPEHCSGLRLGQLHSVNDWRSQSLPAQRHRRLCHRTIKAPVPYGISTGDVNTFPFTDVETAPHEGQPAADTSAVSYSAAARLPTVKLVCRVWPPKVGCVRPSGECPVSTWAADAVVASSAHASLSSPYLTSRDDRSLMPFH
jgi:hypothetical protein